MRSSALTQLMIAEALRACIRGVGLFTEVQASGRSSPAVSLVRALVRTNGVQDLHRELARITACGDLAKPISTYGEIAAREERLVALGRSFGPTQDYVATARRLIGVLPRAVLAGSDGRLLAPVRGHLVVSDETRLQALEARFARTQIALRTASTGSDPILAGQAQGCITLLQSEAAAWRIVDTSGLANRLLVDRGLVDTFAQGRKRARGLLRAHTQSDGDILRNKELADLLRWHRSLTHQLALFEVPKPGGEGDEGAQLRVQACQLEALLADTTDVLELWTVLGGAAGAKRRKRARSEWPRLVESLTEYLRERSAQSLALMRGIYGMSKSNFRALIGSETP